MDELTEDQQRFDAVSSNWGALIFWDDDSRQRILAHQWRIGEAEQPGETGRGKVSWGKSN
jgi:hypothetical protein